MNCLEAALEYHRMGFSVIPLGENKCPAIRWKRYQTNRADERAIRRWFARERGGIAVIFGSISGGLASRDFDDLRGYELWARSNPRLAKLLPTVETNRGRHVYFTVGPDGEREFRMSISKPNSKGAVPCRNGELRIGVGCYSVLPPSRHPSGHIYRWISSFDSFPEIE